MKFFICLLVLVCLTVFSHAATKDVYSVAKKTTQTTTTNLRGRLNTNRFARFTTTSGTRDIASSVQQRVKEQIEQNIADKLKQSKVADTNRPHLTYEKVATVKGTPKYQWKLKDPK